MRLKIIVSGLVIAFLAGCGNDSSDNNIDNDLSALISSNTLTGDPSTDRNISSITSAKAQLGMKLFYTKGLGGAQDSACVTCHHPMLGGGDNLSLPIGVGAIDPDLLGAGRTHDASATHYDNGFAPVPRNAPSTYNIALWDSTIFWDGRIQALTPNAGHNGEVGGIRTPDSAFGVEDVKAGANLAVAQARFPVTSPEEMRDTFQTGQSRDTLRTELVKRYTSGVIANTWEAEFAPVYGANQLSFANVVDAIGEYERSQIFVNTPWKAYVKGDKEAISIEAKRGAKLFFNGYEEGGMNCVACHSGDFFTDESFHVASMPQVGHGKGDGPSHDGDFGRFRETDEANEKYAFRTPTLLNVEMTGPWGHAGGYTSLRAVVAHMVNPDTAVAGYDFSQLDSIVKTDNTQANTDLALAQLNANRNAGISPHQSVEATEGQIDDLVEFLKTLTDPCTKDRDCMGQWIPSHVAGPDSLQLNAVDQNANLL